MSAYTTETGSRPDLALIGRATMEALGGYAFPKLFPLVTEGEKSGTTAVAPAGMTTAQGTASRSDGSSLSGAAVATVSDSWTAARVEGRALVYFSEVKGFGGIENADQAGAENANRKVWNKVEALAYAKVFTSARKSGAAELADKAVVKTLQQKALGVRAYGTPFVVCTTTTFLAFCNIPEIRSRLEKLCGATGDVGYLMLQNDQARIAISSLMGFGGFILFDSSIVDSSDADAGYLAVVGLRPDIAGKVGFEVLRRAKEAATYGIAHVYTPDDATPDAPFELRSWVNDSDKANVYDSEGWIALSENHASAVAMCKLAATYTEFLMVNVTVPAEESAGEGQQ